MKMTYAFLTITALTTISNTSFAKNTSLDAGFIDNMGKTISFVNHEDNGGSCAENGVPAQCLTSVSNQGQQWVVLSDNTDHATSVKLNYQVCKTASCAQFIGPIHITFTQQQGVLTASLDDASNHYKLSPRGNNLWALNRNN